MEAGSTAASPPEPRAWFVLAILSAVQFTAIVDFMVLMPLEPQLERSLGLTPTRFGFVVSSYTYAAGLAGLVVTMLIDRYPRRDAFLSIYGGFLVGTLACALAPSYEYLLAARFLTGAFGGILGGLAMAIIGDIFPEHRRGTATGVLMSAFAVASVAGVPIGLALGLALGWHVPFMVLAALGLPILIFAALALPRLDGHLRRDPHRHPLTQLRETFSHPNHLRAFALMVALTFGGFAVLPFLSPFLVSNVGLRESQLPFVYIAGGVLTLFGAPLVGRLADRFGKLLVFRLVAPLSAVLMLVITNLPPVPLAVAVGLTGALMVSNAGRMVPALAMITSSVDSARRGGFLGANSAVQHLAAGLGSSVAGLLLSKNSAGVLEHYPRAGLVGAASTLVCLWLAGRLRPAERARSHTTVAESPHAAEVAVDVSEPV